MKKFLKALKAMDIDVYQSRKKKVSAEHDEHSFDPVPSQGSILIKNSAAAEINQLDWQSLQGTVSVCTKCALCESRTQTVFGVGNPQADIMFVGEAPGANEDLQGEPFVGRAGQLLNSMLASIGLKREDIFIANVLKCRPPQNRDPTPLEVKTCTPYLIRQIELIQPKLMVALGRVAAQFLLQTDEAMGVLRGRTHQYHHIPLIITYHPAYLLRSPTQKARVWEDLVKIRDWK